MATDSNVSFLVMPVDKRPAFGSQVAKSQKEHRAQLWAPDEQYQRRKKRTMNNFYTKSQATECLGLVG